MQFRLLIHFTPIFRCGICKRRVRKFTMNTTDQTSNNPSNPIPLLARNGRKLSRSTNLVDEV